LDDLKSVAKASGKAALTMNEYDKNGQFNSETLSRRFGSWLRALEKAGLDPERNVSVKKISDDDLTADLKRVAGELHKSSVTTDEYDERGIYSSFTQSHRFGSWFKALAKAGLNKTRNLHVTNEELFNNLVEVWTRLGQQPAYQDLTSQTSKFSAGTYEKRFGTWRKALEAFVAWANTRETQVAGDCTQPSEAPPLTTSGQKAFRHRTSRTINHRLRFLVMRRDNFKCRITGRSPATDPKVILEVDHIVPWDKGGETVMENLQTLAKEINLGKSNLDMFQAD
jgi:5-methylcytosine-specific restriction endonuclease McrA